MLVAPLQSREKFSEGDLIISNIECIEMLSSCTDPCLIFIKTAEAEGVSGGAGAPPPTGRSDRRSQSRVQDQHRGHSHPHLCCCLPSCYHQRCCPSLSDTTAQRKPGPVLGHLAHGAASVTALQAEGHHPCAPRGQPPPTPTPTRGPLCFSVTWSKKNPTLTCSPCCPSSVRVGAGVLSWALGTGAH